MLELFQTIHSALGGGSPQLALLAAMLWGICSVALSPCQIASIPLVVGYIDSQGTMAVRRALAMSAVFALGILVSLTAVSALATLAGHMLGGLGHAGGTLVAAVFLLMGANLLGLLPLRWSMPIESAMRRRGVLAGLGLGLIYGLSLGTMHVRLYRTGAGTEPEGIDPSTAVRAGADAGLRRRALHRHRRRRHQRRPRATIPGLEWQDTRGNLAAPRGRGVADRCRAVPAVHGVRAERRSQKPVARSQKKRLTSPPPKCHPVTGSHHVCHSSGTPFGGAEVGETFARRDISIFSTW